MSKSKLIIGMYSVALFQAFLAGEQIISYQPRKSKKEDPFILNKLKTLKTITTKQELYDSIKQKLSKTTNKEGNQVVTNKYINNHSTQKVIKEVYDLLR